MESREPSRAIVVFAHGKAKDAVLRHLPYWATYSKNIFVVSPADDPLLPCWIAIGESEHSGRGSILRAKLALEEALQLPFEEFLFIEYDTLVFGPVPPKAKGFHSVSFLDPNAREHGFLGNGYCHSPWWVDRETLLALQPFLSLQSLELGYPDRWMTWVLERAVEAGVVVFASIAKAWSSDNLSRFPEEVAEARLARQRGVYFLHGVKTAEQLAIVMAS